jgi:hypothetical protein
VRLRERLAAVAVRNRSAEPLQEALVAVGIAVEALDDYRDHLYPLVTVNHSAAMLGMSFAALVESPTNCRPQDSPGSTSSTDATSATVHCGPSNSKRKAKVQTSATAEPGAATARPGVADSLDSRQPDLAANSVAAPDEHRVAGTAPVTAPNLPLAVQRAPR